MIKINKNDIFAYAIILFPVCGLLEGVFSYYDEIIGAVSLVYIIWQIIRGRINRTDGMIVGLLLIITIIGIFSNLSSRLINDWFAIAVDVLWLWKMYACYIAFRSICENEYKRKRIIQVLSVPARFAVWLTFVTALVGQVVDIGVAGVNEETIWGITQYGFFWNNGIQTGWLLFSSLLILAASQMSTKKYYGYLLMAVVPAVLTFSSLVCCWFLVAVLMSAIFQKNTTFKLRYAVVLVVGLLIVASGDIKTYFASESVRSTWLQYGAITANTYFPLGSGFATFGSEMAARNYSPLYIRYGWEYTWALGREGRFLNDNFLASILGQLGWIGLALYVLLPIRMFVVFNTNKLDKRERVAMLAMIVTILIVMVGSASAKSMMGVCAFSVMGIIGGKISYGGQLKTEPNTNNTKEFTA